VLALPALCLALLLATASPPAQAGGDGCSHDSFVVDRQPVTVQICGPSEAAIRGSGVALIESVESRGTSFSRTVTLDVLAGSEYSRTIDDLPLGRIGIEKSLHLTIRYKAGSVRLEHALLVPGAIALK
jgi:hypothetical protein